MQTTKTKKAKQLLNENPFEALGEIGRGVLGSLGSDLGLGLIKGTKDQVIGLSETENQHGGDLAEGQEVDLTAKKKQARLAESKREEKEKYLRDAEPGIDYRSEILHGEKRIARQQENELTQKIDEIIVELKRLASSSKVLEVKFQEITVEQRIVNPGKYHVSFYEWFLAVIRSARIQVEDAGSWQAMFKSKKAQRQYWNMFKKHGTTFGLSNERVVATQTG